jgi:hypothetical protein
MQRLKTEPAAAWTGVADIVPPGGRTLAGSSLLL